MKDKDKTKEQLINELEEMRKQAGTMSSLSEEEYQKLFDLVPIGVTIVDIKGVVSYCNDAVYNKVGYAKGEFTGKHFSKISSLRVKDIPKYIRVFNSIVRGKTPKPFEAIYQHTDGTIGWTELHIGLLRVGGKRRILVMQNDITERKRAEETLRYERDFAQGLMNTAQAIVLTLDTEGRITYFNPYMEELSGYRLEEVRGKDWFATFLPERYQKKTKKLFLSAIGDIQTRGNINPIIIKDGQERDIEWYDKTLKDASGSITGMLAMGQDITERKRAEEEQRKALEFSDSLITSMQDGLSVLDSNGVHIDVNPALCKMTGFSKEELIGTGPPHPYWPEESYEELQAAFEQTLKGKFKEFELIFNDVGCQ